MSEVRMLQIEVTPIFYGVHPYDKFGELHIYKFENGLGSTASKFGYNARMKTEYYETMIITDIHENEKSEVGYSYELLTSMTRDILKEEDMGENLTVDEVGHFLMLVSKIKNN